MRPPTKAFFVGARSWQVYVLQQVATKAGAWTVSYEVKLGVSNLVGDIVDEVAADRIESAE